MRKSPSRIFDLGFSRHRRGAIEAVQHVQSSVTANKGPGRGVVSAKIIVRRRRETHFVAVGMTALIGGRLALVFAAWSPVIHCMRLLLAIGRAATDPGSSAWAGAIPTRSKSRNGEAKLQALALPPGRRRPVPGGGRAARLRRAANAAGVLGARYRDWGERLAAAGFVVLLPDSYGSRGARQPVRGASRARCAPIASGSATRGGARLAAGAGWVAADRISLLGWSNGGIAALWAVRAAARAARTARPDFRSAVALYPGCRRLRNAAWSARVPTLILIGRADDQTRPADLPADGGGRARTIAIGQQHRKVDFGEALAPILVARAEHAIAVVQAGAIVQPDHRWKRALAVRAVQRRLQTAAVLESGISTASGLPAPPAGPDQTAARIATVNSANRGRIWQKTLGRTAARSVPQASTSCAPRAVMPSDKPFDERA